MRRLSLILFLFLLFTAGYFQHPEPGWNVNSRLALTLALVNDGSAKVDRYINRPGLQTQDVAYFNGHYYSDKVIGTALLGAPAAAATNLADGITGSTMPTATRRGWITWLSVGVSFALAGVLLFHLLARWRALLRPEDTPATAGWPLLAAAATMLGTLLMPYSGLFMPYAPMMMFLVASLLVLEQRGFREGRRSLAACFAAGLLGGLAILCELTAGAAVVLAGIYVLSRARSLGRFALYGAGAVVGLMPFAVYTLSIFGRLAIPYEFHAVEEFRTSMARGFMGATTPDADVLLLITFHPYRGIFVASPLLLLGAVGLLLAFRRGGPARQLGAISLVVVAFYLLFSSAYYMWWGGWSFSARHLAPALPFLAGGIMALPARPGIRIIAMMMALWGILLHLVATAADPQIPDRPYLESLLNPDLRRFDYPVPFLNWSLPRLLHGPAEPNLGAWLGLPPGPFSLLPWLAAAALALWLARRSLRRP